MGISGWFGLEAIAYSLNYTIIMDVNYLKLRVFCFFPCPELSNYRQIPNFGPESGLRLPLHQTSFDPAGYQSAEIA